MRQVGPNLPEVSWTKLLASQCTFRLLFKRKAKFRASNLPAGKNLIEVVIANSALLCQCAAGWYVYGHAANSIFSIGLVKRFDRYF